MLIPRRPLRPYTRYSANATFAPDEGTPLTVAWTFETGPYANYVQSYGVNGLRRAGKGWTVQYDFSTRAPRDEVTLTATHTRAIHVRLFEAGYAAPGTLGAPSRQYNALARVPYGNWMLCASSGGRGTQYAPVRRCESLRVSHAGVRQH